jgi:hypothetical protein
VRRFRQIAAWLRRAVKVVSAPVAATEFCPYLHKRPVRAKWCSEWNSRTSIFAEHVCGMHKYGPKSELEGWFMRSVLIANHDATCRHSPRYWRK